ncbi:hypothetical protein BGZ65_004549, partial [Modicella reniformis]
YDEMDSAIDTLTENLENGEYFRQDFPRACRDQQDFRDQQGLPRLRRIENKRLNKTGFGTMSWPLLHEFL